MVAVEALSQTRGGFARDADDFPQQTCGDDAGVVDFGAVFGRVPAIDAAAGEVDADVGAVKVLGPEAGRLRIPVNRLPLGCVGAAGEDDDVMSAVGK